MERCSGRGPGTEGTGRALATAQGPVLAMEPERGQGPAMARAQAQAQGAKAQARGWVPAQGTAPVPETGPELVMAQGRAPELRPVASAAASRSRREPRGAA
jgi:hypothetical protein